MTDLMREAPKRNPRMMGPAVTYPFLDVRPSIPGRCFVLQGDDIIPIDTPVPDWWWIFEDRNIAISVSLPGEGVLWTVFTCVANEDGTLFETAYILGDLIRIVARAHTIREAREEHIRWLNLLRPASGS